MRERERADRRGATRGGVERREERREREMSNAPSAEELESFRWGGVRARPRKKIAGETRRGETYLKPPGSLGSRWPSLGISLSI
eukprot:scaffold152843_cov22-Tisochrysis_lutea.AAC.1